MNPIDLFLVQLNTYLGEFIHMGSSGSSQLAVSLGWF
ncbi:hypothetical protein CENDO_01395 [Corynebacterium endometrii]|uniref:Uncharacterized protein n=1 Tax=Corynebacterium endometrii TaxID=2488819 RepID=A0A4P7QDB5_9CORY|nr:hypothetical protein CENDO_01395 [Corynebacterium endometrii]